MITYHEYPNIAGVEIVLSDTASRDEYADVAERLAEFSSTKRVVSLYLEVVLSKKEISPLLWRDVQGMLFSLGSDSRCAIISEERWRVWLVTSGIVMAPCTVRLFNHAHSARARGWLLAGQSWKENLLQTVPTHATRQSSVA